ncbi:Vacuolar ATP synthase 16 kDa proteolipid subunit [Giardia muris]|uniref:V-type proton ATPase proteolipid subunit n=1 Tax=Giardia muris TaxID=5742 RepID=A0A4Z1STZ6_GIAMU|nr:Vacuolar ATP synthase 16 kDa proteolipid subunit [Giardia muris]|eukprot:TNJ29366.1 Vacuolar ATP synthase 16 kDa proteolipid subunit [Giardia muris]
MSSGTGNSTTINYACCPPGSSFWAVLGQTIAIVFSSIGAAYGTAKAGAGIGTAGLINPGQVTKLMLPVIMAGILSIYGLITAIIINSNVTSATKTGAFGMPYMQAHAQFGAGLCTGLSALAAGLAIGVAGNAAAKAVAKQPSLFVVMLIILIFAEALALYGLIVSLIMATSGGSDVKCTS